MSIRDFSLLIRGHVSLMVAASAACGWLLARPLPVLTDPGLAWTFTGCAVLAWACSIWNQVQERDVDALLPRTQNRPLPRGRVAVRSAVLLGLACFLVAALCLYQAGGAALVCMAFIVVGTYNGIYTPLKRVTAFALLVGALVGALPPVLGWMCAGGQVHDPDLWLLYGVYGLWQIPHFWLRTERDSPAYATAGLPLPAAQFSGPGYRRLLQLWVQAHAASVLLLPLYFFVHNTASRGFLALLGIVLCLNATWLTGGRQTLRLTDGGTAAAIAVLVLDRCIAAA